MDFQFKVPDLVPQDILLIQEIVGVVPLPKADIWKDVHKSADSSDDSIASSSSEIDSEDEVEADLMVPEEESSNLTPVLPGSPESEPSSDSDSSDSDSESDEDETADKAGDKNAQDPRKPQIDVDDDEESGATAVASYVQTKNEIVETDIVVPSVSEVGPEEVLDKVGEVMNIIGNVVIVKGLPADSSRAASEKALDVETLLVFDDRQVLGHVYETFGPTSQPLYQIKFNQSYPLDTEKIRVAREVYHIPQRSNFVFTEYLQKLRGSDASNIHDEEPGEDEMEFSDDEQEAAFKQARKKKRGMSVSSSRRTTPTPSQSHYNDDIDNIFYGANPYDAHGPYDDGYRVAGPSRPAPIPYDDPYADEIKVDIVKYEEDLSGPSTEARLSGRELERNFGDGRGRGRWRGRGYDRGGGARDRGRGRGHGRPDRGRRSWGESRWSQQNPTASSMEPYNTSTSIPLSPAPDEIERGTNQPVGIPGYSSQPFSPSPMWGYPSGDFQVHQFGQRQQQQSVQPHINPRFASAFGFNGPPAWFENQEARFNSYQVQQPSQPWTNQWLVHGQEYENAESDAYTPI
ncbi:Gar1/Naf1 RNA binding region-domain-containing protein [Suillus subaureus]|uniref:H/ACA ribonucleoprotein complex non-core subunit NAF1 n=1 Tax=Suillus subaureus TaxID=48587 RepID=A0A9P7E821_9AGAM|nr:Gar1/Naf1 RNA binding region-domain-containing protein [Suillus subaureus]KAG1813348.1 Gar1/Naf1 RNA binding region-domain-containing protein [Suillus subaureus]